MKTQKSKKKPCKKNTLHNYYQPVLNSQGFPVHLCKYEDSIKDLAYVPKKYQEIAKPTYVSTFCSHCKLTPCASHFHYKELCQKASSIIVENKGTALLANKRCETLMKAHMRRYFGAKYTREVGLPECFYDALGSIIPFLESTRVCSIAGCPCGQSTDSPNNAACLVADAQSEDKVHSSAAAGEDHHYATQDEHTLARSNAAEEISDHEFEF